MQRFAQWLRQARSSTPFTSKPINQHESMMDGWMDAQKPRDNHSTHTGTADGQGPDNLAKQSAIISPHTGVRGSAHASHPGAYVTRNDTNHSSNSARNCQLHEPIAIAYRLAAIHSATTHIRRNRPSARPNSVCLSWFDFLL